MAVGVGALLVNFKSAGNATTTGAVAIGTAVSVGDYIAVFTEGSGTSAVTSAVSDSKGHTWTAQTKLYNTATGGGFVQAFYTKVTSAMLTTDTITVTRTGTGSLLAQAVRLTDVDPSTATVGTPVTGVNATGNTTITTSGAITVGDGDLVIAGVEMASAMTALSAVGAGFTELIDGVSTSTNARAMGVLYQVKSGAGSVTPSATGQASGLWAIYGMGFKAAPVAYTGTSALSATATTAAAGTANASTGSSLAATGTITAAGTVSTPGLSTGSSLSATDTIIASGAATGTASRTATATTTATGSTGITSGASRANAATITATGATGTATGANLSAAATVTAAGSVTVGGSTTPSLRSISAATASGSATAITWPTVPTHQTGDVILAILNRNNSPDAGGNPLTADPTASGWTLLRSAADNGTLPAGAHLGIWYKVATSSSETAPSATSTSSCQWATYFAVYKDVGTGGPFLAESGLAESSTTTTHSAPAVTNTDAAALGVAIFTARQAASPVSWSAVSPLVSRFSYDQGQTNTTNIFGMLADTGGAVATGAQTYQGTTSTSTGIEYAWTGFLRPAAGGAPSNDATVSATATLSAAGVVGTSAGSSAAAAVTVTAAGATNASTGATLAATGTIAAAGSVGKSSGAALAATDTISASAGGNVATGSSIAAVATMTAAGQVAASSTATRPETATLAASGVVGKQAGVTLSTTASLTAAGNVATSKGATVVATVTVTATGTVGVSSGASLTATASVGAGPKATGTVTVNASGTITAASILGTSSPAAVVATGTISADGTVRVTSSATLAAVASIAATGAAVAPSVTPSTRAFVVTAEDRTSFVAAEVRTHAVALEPRTFAVEHQDRTDVVPEAARVITPI